MTIFKLKIDERVIVGLTIAGFIVLCLVPLLLISRYNHPCADDFGYGYNAHVTWRETHNLLSTVKSAVQTSAHTYKTWQGTYSSVFFMALTPVVFGEQYYFIVPFIMLSSLIASVLYLNKVLLIDLCKSSKSAWIITSLAVLLVMIEGIYTPASAFFWYNAAIHYTFMQACMFFLVAVCIQLIRQTKTGLRIVYASLAVILSVLVAGSNYLNSLMGCILLFVLAVSRLIYAIKSKDKIKTTSALFLFGVFIVYILLFLCNIKAPGNEVRLADYVEYSALKAVGMSFVSGFKRGAGFFSCFTLAVMIAVIPCIWGVVRKMSFSFRFPLLIFVLSFCLFSAMFTPLYFSIGNDYLPRALNNAKMFYHLLLFINEFYIIGHIQYHLKKRSSFNIEHYLLFYIGVIALLFSVFLVNPNKEAFYPSYASFKYMREGFAQLYHHEYMVRLNQLTQEEPIVSLDEFQPKLNVLYVDDVTTDPGNWRNTQVATWYGKTQVFLNPTPPSGGDSANSIIGGADEPTSVFLAGKIDGNKTETYKQINMEEAKQFFNEASDDSYIIVDVRRADEFAEGHIPRAINVANESIGAEAPEELPDKDQIIYVYCRSGNRSKQAADKLTALGYSNVIEFGGIIDWTGEIEK